MSEVFNNIQPKVSYTAPPVTPANQSQTTVADAIAAAPAQDSVQISKPKAERKGLVKSINEGIGNFKKFLASAETYTVAVFKGLFKGAILGSLTYAGGMLINGVRKFVYNHRANSAKVTEAIKTQATEKLAKLGKSNKLVAAGAAVLGVVTFVGTLWKANLDLNEKKSDIEHRFVGHKQ